ncbi:membrane protein [Pandoraea horticolens]|uniref:Membrane protein n=1 Tax=Pandoraea horticolens TaxID=2508298 RepID=A0A5E4YUY9_9BURK|nr:membrane protein [Pandoraea horticolens]
MNANIQTIGSRSCSPRLRGRRWGTGLPIAGLGYTGAAVVFGTLLQVLVGAYFWMSRYSASFALLAFILSSLLLVRQRASAKAH